MFYQIKPFWDFVLPALFISGTGIHIVIQVPESCCIEPAGNCGAGKAVKSPDKDLIHTKVSLTKTLYTPR